MESLRSPVDSWPYRSNPLAGTVAFFLFESGERQELQTTVGRVMPWPDDNTRLWVSFYGLQTMLINAHDDYDITEAHACGAVEVVFRRHPDIITLSEHGVQLPPRGRTMAELRWFLGNGERVAHARVLALHVQSTARDGDTRLGLGELRALFTGVFGTVVPVTDEQIARAVARFASWAAGVSAATFSDEGGELCVCGTAADVRLAAQHVLNQQQFALDGPETSYLQTSPSGNFAKYVPICERGAGQGLKRVAGHMLHAAGGRPLVVSDALALGGSMEAARQREAAAALRTPAGQMQLREKEKQRERGRREREAKQRKLLGPDQKHLDNMT